MQNVTQSVVQQRQEGERLFRPQSLHQTLVSHCLSAESLPVGLGVLLAHPHVKHISLNISHSPPTLPQCLIMDSAKYLNPAQLSRSGDNERKLFFPTEQSRLEAAAVGREERRKHTGFTAWRQGQYLCKKNPQIYLNCIDLTKHD